MSNRSPLFPDRPIGPGMERTDGHTVRVPVGSRELRKGWKRGPQARKPSNYNLLQNTPPIRWS